MTHTPSKTTPRHAGFTLVELLAVVIIIGILAAVAVPVYSHYIVSARATEATTLIPQIRLKEENYKLEFNQFLSAPSNPNSTQWTSKIANGEQGIWDTSTAMKNWNQIGFTPPTPGVYFQYYVNTGTSATTKITANSAFDCYGLIVAKVHYPPGTGDTWYTICALGNLRGASAGTSATDPGMVVGMSSSSSIQRVFSNLKRK